LILSLNYFEKRSNWKRTERLKSRTIKGISFFIDLILYVGNEMCHLQFYNTNLGLIRLEANDFYDCLNALRIILEKQDLFPLCNGATKNIAVSRMTRQMGHGMKCYQIELEKQASIKSMVDLFDPAKPVFVVTVEEQKQFYNLWIES
jgi:hypothetical protein